MFELAYASGLRAEELVSLDLEAIDFDGESVRVEGKGGKTRIVPAGEHSLKALERYIVTGRPTLSTGETRALFLSKSGRRLSTSDVRRRLRTWSRLASGQVPALSGTHPHALRHSFATHLLGGRRRPARDPGVAWTRKHLDDSGLHSGRVGAASLRL